MKGKVYFVGAGPGDPELLTLKGRRLLSEAEVVIYAGSLINPALLSGLSAELYDSSKMSLEEILEVIEGAVSRGKTVVRLHSGDPSYYGAIHEQIAALSTREIPYEIVPGVTSASAGAARLGIELTVPEVAQTVVFTRLGGKTPGPTLDDLSSFARKDVTLVLFLSVSQVEEIEKALLKKLPPETPVAVVEKVTWPEERIIRGRLTGLARLVKDSGIKKTALIYVGQVVEALGRHSERRSKLYGPKNFQ